MKHDHKATAEALRSIGEEEQPMPEQNWTPEPNWWPEGQPGGTNCGRQLRSDNGTDGEYAHDGNWILSDANFQHAEKCVDAMKGIPDPAAFVEAVEKLAGYARVATSTMNSAADLLADAGYKTFAVVTRSHSQLLETALAAFPDMASDGDTT